MRAEIVARHRTVKGKGGQGKGTNFVPEGRMNELVKGMQEFCLGLTTEDSHIKSKKIQKITNQNIDIFPGGGHLFLWVGTEGGLRELIPAQAAKSKRCLEELIKFG